MKEIKTLDELKQFTEKCIQNETLPKMLPYIRKCCRTFKTKLKNILPEYYWDINRTMTHNALFYFIVGNRGGGKTFGAKERAIENFIKKKEQFGYIRRYRDDLLLSMPTFFKDIEEDYPDYEFKTDSGKFYIRLKPENEDEKWTDDDIAGYGLILSTADNKKSVPYPNVSMLIYDEFMLDDRKNVKYIKNEVMSLLNLYETVARPSSGHIPVSLWCLSNALSVTNPYFLFFNLRMPSKKDKNGKWIWRHPCGEIVVEEVKNDLFIKMKRADRFGRIVAGTDYEDYSINNKMLYDDDTFIAKRSPKARHAFYFVYKGYNFGVWVDFKENKMYVSDAFDPYGQKYAITMEDHSPDTKYLKSRYKDGFFKMFVESFKDGSLYFENMNLKNMCFEVLNKILY